MAEKKYSTAHISLNQGTIIWQDFTSSIEEARAKADEYTRIWHVMHGDPSYGVWNIWELTDTSNSNCYKLETLIEVYHPEALIMELLLEASNVA